VSQSISVVIAEDHPVFRKGLCEVLGASSAFDIVGEAGDGSAALDLVRRHRPRIALLDIEMPVLTGLEVADAIRKEELGAAVVILTMYRDARMLRRALDLGTKGYVLKDSAVTEIVACLEMVARGRVYVSGAIAGAADARGTDRTAPGDGTALATLTAAERRVLRLIAQDLTSAEIAARLGISPKTVENHRSHMCRKLGLRRPQALLRFALAQQDLP
jgi:DNA-binding NarL/FixJ family response regulator